MYNVLSILFLGPLIESRIGFAVTLAIWLLAGGLGTAFTSQFGVAPWNTATSASQAALALAGFGLVIYTSPVERSHLLLGAVVFAVLPALYLDLKTAGHLKPGHALSLILGGIMALGYMLNTRRARAGTVTLRS